RRSGISRSARGAAPRRPRASGARPRVPARARRQDGFRRHTDRDRAGAAHAVVGVGCRARALPAVRQAVAPRGRCRRAGPRSRPVVPVSRARSRRHPPASAARGRRRQRERRVPRAVRPGQRGVVLDGPVHVAALPARAVRLVVVPQSGETLIAGRRPWTIAAIVFAVAASAIALATLHRFGATWDEEHSMRQGDLVLRWYASGFTDRRVIDEGNFRFYGGFFNVVVQLVHRAGAPLYGASHVITLLFALVSLPLAYWIGATAFSPAAGFFSMALLWLTPVYYGHSFNNPKDAPFAVMSLASLATIISCWDHLPRPPVRVWLRTAIVIGLTMAIRIGGLVLFEYLALSWLAWLAIRGGDTRPARVRSFLQLAITGAQIFVVAWLLMCVFWPWAQESPVHGPWRGLLAARRFTDFTAIVRFQGLDILSDQLPRTYVPIILGITLPEFYFLIA